MSLLEEGALNRLTAAVLALAVTVERQGPDAPPDVLMAHENVQDRYERELDRILYPEGDG